jgi:ribosome-associated protein
MKPSVDSPKEPPRSSASPASAGRKDASRPRALAAARIAEETRGSDVRVLDLRGVTPMFDYFVIATGSSGRQIHAMADEIKREIAKEFADKPRGTEGYEEGRWIVLDYGDVVVHLFDADAREFWDLEGLWSDAKTVAAKA